METPVICRVLDSSARRDLYKPTAVFEVTSLVKETGCSVPDGVRAVNFAHARRERRIQKARVHQPDQFGKKAQVTVWFEENHPVRLFGFFPDEIHFCESELVGKTRRQALDLADMAASAAERALVDAFSGNWFRVNKAEEPARLAGKWLADFDAEYKRVADVYHCRDFTDMSVEEAATLAVGLMEAYGMSAEDYSMFPPDTRIHQLLKAVAG